VWKRATEFCPGDLPTVFFEGIDPGDVAQGILGDCYFLSALSVLAEHPHRIRKLFVTQEGNYEGMYQVTWFQNGSPIVVTVGTWCAFQLWK
jgi:cytochrome c-type biogenesis protein CcmE